MMENLVAELKKRVLFKDVTAVGDIVLLFSKDPQTLVYAMVTNIKPDKTRKEAWWNVTMQVLAVPPREVVWTLREPQFTGQEIFSFGGIEHFMKAVRFESTPTAPASTEENDNEKAKKSKTRLRIVK
jgi:hypothetical protein